MKKKKKLLVYSHVQQGSIGSSVFMAEFQRAVKWDLQYQC